MSFKIILAVSLPAILVASCVRKPAEPVQPEPNVKPAIVEPKPLVEHQLTKEEIQKENLQKLGVTITEDHG